MLNLQKKAHFQVFDWHGESPTLRLDANAFFQFQRLVYQEGVYRIPLLHTFVRWLTDVSQHLTMTEPGLGGTYKVANQPMARCFYGPPEKLLVGREVHAGTAANGH